MNVKVLEREMYSEAEAARLLGVARNTLNYWLEGCERQGKTYKPIIRFEPKGGRALVTWAEFVEAGWLREYRQSHGVPMAELRTFIDASTLCGPARTSFIRSPTIDHLSQTENCCATPRTSLA